MAAHGEAQMLLPWYATGQLDEADRCLVDAHLANCAACRAALVVEQAMGRRVTGLSLDTELGWDDMRRKLKNRRMGERRSSIGARMSHLPRWIGFALAAQMLLLVTAIVAFAPVGRPASYHVLSTTPSATRGNALVMFRPDAKAEELMRALSATGVRVVDGPTAAGAWIANVAPGGRTDALARLRAQRAVAMAEPIDP
ncbi:zf-HC2 domain-containing protein [Sphingomonas sp. AP4-R1]|uniref:zf-HC2 domain-containing protein n=1 Tax=Sphingomonas sp. AP4-R1 TaxID=2735134 RepID=UPI001493CB91|nr:zf-HC2 domain-containing protein [Sphingomonas sp. AP4-R1]QJU59978.1 zf-HC2 domain-containing protein [Sphingomonas sp. AP4-R1]